MACVRDILPYVNLHTQDIPYEKVASLEVRMSHFMAALMEIDPSAIREVFVEIPDVSWEDIGGLEDVKEELIQAVSWPLRHAEVFERYSVQPTRGIMLHGPSGTGKTLLAKALAKESGVNFISVKGPSLMSRYVGESERAIREYTPGYLLLFQQLQADLQSPAGIYHMRKASAFCRSALNSLQVFPRLSFSAVCSSLY